MSLRAVFLRFTIAYLVIMAAGGVIAGLFEIRHASAVNTPILIAITYWCFYSFSINNKRIVAKEEKWKIIWLMLAGDFLVTVILGAPSVILGNLPVSAMDVAVAMGIVMPLHFLTFMVIEYLVRKHLIKQTIFQDQNGPS